MNKSNINIILGTVAFSVLALLALSSSTSAQTTTPWQANGNNIYYNSGRVGIGTATATEELDINGDIKIRGPKNTAGSGGQINFTAFGRNHLGPRISSNLDFAAGTSSKASLVLSSYWGGYKNEMTLRDGKVGIGTGTPQADLHIHSDSNSGQLLLDKNGGGGQEIVMKSATGDVQNQSIRLVSKGDEEKGLNISSFWDGNKIRNYGQNLRIVKDGRGSQDVVISSNDVADGAEQNQHLKLLFASNKYLSIESRWDGHKIFATTNRPLSLGNTNKKNLIEMGIDNTVCIGNC